MTILQELKVRLFDIFGIYYLRNSCEMKILSLQCVNRTMRKYKLL